MWGTASNVNCCGLRIPLACPVTLLRTAGHPQTHAHMAEQPISLDGANGVSPGASNANVEGGDPVGDVVATIGPRATLASARDPEAVLNRSGSISRLPQRLAHWHGRVQAMRGGRRFRRC